MIEQPSNNTEKILIPDLDVLKRELGILFNIQELDFDPFRTTREALDSLLQSLKHIADQQAKKAEIQRFIQEQKENERESIQSDARDVRATIATGMGFAIPGIGGLAGGIGGAGVVAITAGLMKAYEMKNPEASGWDKTMHSISAYSEAISYVTMRFIHKTPIGGILRWFGIKEPKNPLQDLIPDTQNSVGNISSTVTEVVRGVELPNKRDINRNIFFQFFSAENELSELPNIDFNGQQYNKVIHEIVSTRDNFFKNLRYSDFQDKDTIQRRIRDRIQTRVQSIPHNKIDMYIRIFIANIVGDTIQARITSNLGSDAIQSIHIMNGAQFIKDVYNKDDINIETVQPSPTMEEIFTKLSSLGQFGGIFTHIENPQDFSLSDANLEKLQSRFSGNTFNLFSEGIGKVRDFQEADMIEVIAPISGMGFISKTNFKDVSEAMYRSHSSRTLGTRFAIDSTANDFGGEKRIETISLGNEKTMTDFLDHLYVFGNTLGASLQREGMLGDGYDISSINVRDIYILYLLTGGKTDLASLGTIEKTQLMLFCQFHFVTPGARGVGVQLGQGIDAMINGTDKAGDGIKNFLNRESNADIKNFLRAIGRFFMRVLKASINAVKNVFQGLFEYDEAIGSGVVALIIGTPVFSKRTSIAGMFS